MAINSINNYVSAASTVATDSKVSSKKTESSKNDTSTGVIYEKGLQRQEQFFPKDTELCSHCKDES